MSDTDKRQATIRRRVRQAQLTTAPDLSVDEFLADLEGDKEKFAMKPIQTISMADFRDNYRAVLKNLAKGPVRLVRQDEFVAVLVSGEEWNRLNTELQQMRRHAQADQDFVEMRQGKYTEG